MSHDTTTDNTTDTFVDFTIVLQTNANDTPARFPHRYHTTDTDPIDLCRVYADTVETCVIRGFLNDRAGSIFTPNAEGFDAWKGRLGRAWSMCLHLVYSRVFSQQ